MLFYGGYTTSRSISSLNTGASALIASVNADTNTRQWARVYDVPGDGAYTARFISGLAYESTGNRVAVYAQ